MAQFLTPAFLQASDASGNPLVGAKQYIYATGTTTLLSLYSNEALSTPLSNPLIADAAGVFPGCFIAETKFKVILKSSADVTLYTRDPVYSTGQADSVSAANVSFDGSGIGFSSTDVQAAIVELYGSVPHLSGATFVGPVGATSLGATSTDSGSTPGPFISAIRNSASPAVSDFIGQFPFWGNNLLGTAITYATFGAQITDPTTGSEDGIVFAKTYVAGANAIRWSTGAGFYMTGATGGDKGAGTVNATALYKNGTALPLTGAYVSAQQSITAASTVTLAHSLGAAPALIQASLVCLTAEGGYSIADQVLINPNYQANGTNGGLSIVFDATNLVIRIGSSAGGLRIIRKDTGAAIDITNANWALIVKAWA